MSAEQKLFNDLVDCHSTLLNDVKSGHIKHSDCSSILKETREFLKWLGFAALPAPGSGLEKLKKDMEVPYPTATKTEDIPF